MKTLIKLSCVAGIIQFGFACLWASDLVLLSGFWSGFEIDREGESNVSIFIKEDVLVFQGADPEEWYEAKFTLLENETPKQIVTEITDSSSSKFVGKKSYAIYQVDDDTFTMTGNEPGNPQAPTSFEESGARKFVFMRE